MRNRKPWAGVLDLEIDAKWRALFDTFRRVGRDRSQRPDAEGPPGYQRHCPEDECQPDKGLRTDSRQLKQPPMLIGPMENQRFSPIHLLRITINLMSQLRQIIRLHRHKRRIVRRPRSLVIHPPPIETCRRGRIDEQRGGGRWPWRDRRFRRR